jgi:predicted RNA binding protein YcfA (HicA-like mRNA interferase family)
MMPLNRSDIEAALKKKGFQSSSGDHYFFTYYTQAGQKTSVWTKTSHGSGYKTLSDGLVSNMAKQCGLTTPQFKNLVACPLTQEAMEQVLIDTGRIKIGVQDSKK